MIEVTSAALTRSKKPSMSVILGYIEKKIICTLENTESALSRGALISQITGTDLSYCYRVICENLEGLNGIMQFKPDPEDMEVLHRFAMQNTRYRFRPYLTMDIQDGDPFMVLTIPATHEMMPGILYPDIRKIVQKQLKTDEVKIVFLAGGNVVITSILTNIGSALYAAVRTYPALEVKLLSQNIYKLDLNTGDMQILQQIPGIGDVDGKRDDD